MIRIIIRTCNDYMASHVGGPVVTDYKTFDVELKEVEGFLRAKHDDIYTDRRVQGIELLDEDHR